MPDPSVSSSTTSVYAELADPGDEVGQGWRRREEGDPASGHVQAVVAELEDNLASRRSFLEMAQRASADYTG